MAVFLRVRCPSPIPLLCLALAGAAPQAWAGGTLLLLDAPPAEATWSAGMSWRGWPRAPGSAHERYSLLPALDYESPSGVFVATDTGLGWNLAPKLLEGEAARQWQFGARLWPQSGRSRRESPPGVQSLGSRLITQLFANNQVMPELLLQSGLSWGSGRHRNGGQLELGATSGIPIGSELLAISLSATYANAAHLRGTFGVGPAEAAASGLPTFRPHSGWLDWSMALSAEHKFSNNWSVNGQWLHTRLVGQAANSPLTYSRDQPSFIVSVWHQF
ncbi:MipA/OmpV family protein [Roseateles saccharophilus]|uniref:Outer membrane protein n=1 Tax=Roseateles saccharophilus TaxID=304 RepID=A0A4R3URV3_ROSSA|nr:MipA/OmpV family protein [Roseateles saccharophilus]MDG0833351.1 MipA/OmpV family protein [Roseateles saccharophilus]TCU93802.1 outer membrane protein [Roseateles saccharophilus]